MRRTRGQRKQAPPLTKAENAAQVAGKVAVEQQAIMIVVVTMVMTMFSRIIQLAAWAIKGLFVQLIGQPAILP